MWKGSCYKTAHGNDASHYDQGRRPSCGYNEPTSYVWPWDPLTLFNIQSQNPILNIFSYFGSIGLSDHQYLYGGIRQIQLTPSEFILAGTASSCSSFTTRFRFCHSRSRRHHSRSRTASFFESRIGRWFLITWYMYLFRNWCLNCSYIKS